MFRTNLGAKVRFLFCCTKKTANKKWAFDALFSRKVMFLEKEGSKRCFNVWSPGVLWSKTDLSIIC